MKARTKRLLYFLLWGAETLMRPTLRNVTESFEGWAYRSGLLYDIQDLENQQFLERKEKAGRCFYRLTEMGRLQALGGRDPHQQWNRPWDGQWRLVLFDIPQAQHLARLGLTRFLRAQGFGNLQKSVWVSPDFPNNIPKSLGELKLTVDCLVTFQAQPAAGEDDHEIVHQAWNFEKINKQYQDCLEVLKAFPRRLPTTTEDKQRLLRWAQSEQALWLRAVSADPLLPSVLLPSDYMGQRTWELRQTVLARAGDFLP